MACRVIAQYNYTQAVPALMKFLEKPNWSCVYPARALAKMKVSKSYESIMKLINDKSAGNRKYFVEALAQLDDKRAIRFFLDRLDRAVKTPNLRRQSDSTWSLEETKSTAQFLGRHKVLQAVEPLTQLLARDYIRVRPYRKLLNSIVVALGRFGPLAAKATPVLRQMRYKIKNKSFHELVKKSIGLIEVKKTQ
ncbi:MAG: HEAT repeat domain-containing protein [Phycisphaerae bacterium]|jgi:HEAT repeat protein|nr:HEAT repeat domain-containing protein [Phycisphaerae bacterium]MDP7288044.1 HEAT repeat domain-containing protein [Phycisphaerae bacterium]